MKGRHFSSDADVIAPAQTWLDGQYSEYFLSDLQKLEQRAKKCIEFRGMFNKSRVWSLQLVSFRVGLRTYQHALVLMAMTPFTVTVPPTVCCCSNIGTGGFKTRPMHRFMSASSCACIFLYTERRSKGLIRHQRRPTKSE